VRGATGILHHRSPCRRLEEDTLASFEGSSSSGLTRGSRHKPSMARRSRQAAPFPEKGGRLPRILQRIQQNKIFSSPPISTLVDSSPSRLRIHLTMRCQARRGRRRVRALSQVQIPGPLQRSPSGRGAEVMGSDALVTGYPDRKDVPQRHTDKAPTLSRT